MTGDPTLLSQLVGGEPARLAVVLAGKSRIRWRKCSSTSSSARTGVPNLTHAYEYLKEEETEGVRGWSRFKEIPAERIKAKAKKKRELKQQLADEVERLKQDGRLLCFEEHKESMAHAFAMNEGFLAAWTDHLRNVASFAIYTKPWDAPQPLSLETPGHIMAVVSDASRTRFAVAGGSCVRAWDVDAGQWKLVADIPETDLTLSAVLSADGKRIAHSSRREIRVTEVLNHRARFVDRKKKQTVAGVMKISSP